MNISELCNVLDNIFKIKQFSSIDSSLNGLQVGSSNKEIKKIGFSVSASLNIFKLAKKSNCDMVFVHHGLFWGKPESITGYKYERIKFLLDNDIALFACHLPLDTHEKFSNNAGMTEELQLEDVRGFASYKGFNMGLYGTLKNALSYEEIKKRVCTSVIIDEPKTVLCTNKMKKYNKVGIVSGSGSKDVYEAIELGLEVFITGDFSFNEYFPVLESGITLMCLGHYETERYGVIRIMNFLRSNYNIETLFLEDIKEGNENE